MKLASRGFSLLEMIVGIAITSLFVGLIFSGFRLMNAESTLSMGRADAQNSALLAFGKILEVGRMAQQCQLTAAGELQCLVDFSIPSGSLPPVSVRFVLNGTTLRYQRQAAGGAWENQMAFDDMLAFTVCDDARMAPGGRCPLQPAALSAKHRADLTAGAFPAAANRFFRFSLVQNLTPRAAAAQTFAVQGAFYVRNPIPLPPGIPPGSVVYQWGGFAQ
jgi:prepilin-type N-terminal cleavage/methylation domain-containing protein